MAEVEELPTFGAELKDGFKPANAWVGHGIAWLEDIQSYYRERSAIEKEYSARLNVLAKKYFEKKNKKTSQLSVGDTPALTPGSLESASLTTWTTQLTTLESRAAEHDRYANSLLSQVAEPLKYYATRFEDLRKRHSDFADKLMAEREASYADLRKVKTKYDGVCQEVEAKRKKSESHYDKAKAQSAYQLQLHEMNNAKNSYLIAINVTNRLKERYYHEYIPEVMDGLQDLNEFRTIKLSMIWKVASQLEGDMLQQSHGMMERLGQEITRNEPHLDSMMYMRHNIGGFQEAPDKVFEPSPVWHDDNTMVVDETAKVFLFNILSKSKTSLGELRREVDRKRRDVEGVRRTKQRIREGTEKKDEVEVVRALFALQEDLHAVDRRRLTAEVETTTITGAVGDVTLGAKSHNFKSQTFKIPTNCDLCGDRIWGLSAKGFDCRDCGYTCHSKCEMKVPANCPGEQTKEERKKLKAERQAAATQLLRPTASSTHVGDQGPELSRSDTMNSLSSHSARMSISTGALSPTDETMAQDADPRPSISSAKSSGTMRKNRVVAPPPAAYMTDGSAGMNGSGAGRHEKRGKMLYDFEPTGDGELSVQEGSEVVEVEPDDGSGWVKVRYRGDEGVVPTSYVDFTAAPAAPAPAPRPSSSSTTSSTAQPSAGPLSPTASSALVSALQKKKQGPAVAPKRGAKKLPDVVALYDYEARSEEERSMDQGESLKLVNDLGDGWVEVEGAGQKGIVPKSYVQGV